MDSMSKYVFVTYENNIMYKFNRIENFKMFLYDKLPYKNINIQ